MYCQAPFTPKMEYIMRSRLIALAAATGAATTAGVVLANSASAEPLVLNILGLIKITLRLF